MLTDLRLGKHLNDIVGDNFMLITECLKSCMFNPTCLQKTQSITINKPIVMKVLIKSQRGVERTVDK